MATLKQLDRATFDKVRDITHKYNVESIYITKYIVESGQYDVSTMTDKTEKLIANQASRILHIISKTVKQLCDSFGVMPDTQVSIYRMVLNNEQLCEYFLNNTPENVMKDSQTKDGKGVGDITIEQFLRSIAPSMDMGAESKENSPWS